MQDLRVTVIQAATRWHDPAANRDLYGALARGVKGQTDLVVLPETFTSGFTNETLGNAEDGNGESARWLRALAGEVGAVITGSMVTRDGDRYFNRLYWMRPDGSCPTYDKRHLFRFANEHQRYAGGSDRLIVELGGWRVCPLICYDLRFPVYARNRFGVSRPGAFDYDLLIHVANWPAPRHHAWRTLLRARSIENLCYGIGVNRVGADGNKLEYLGGSAMLDPAGQPLLECGNQQQVATVTLSAAGLAAHRERFPFHLDADAFDLSP
jgi:predicted amidohydrolase